MCLPQSDFLCCLPAFVNQIRVFLPNMKPSGSFPIQSRLKSLDRQGFWAWPINVEQKGNVCKEHSFKVLKVFHECTFLPLPGNRQ